MDLKYNIEEEISGEKRNYKEGTKKALLLECDGICPKCKKVKANIKIENLDSDNYDKLNLEIAHIYGLNNFKKLNKLNKKFHIKYKQEINTYKNLILLCHECHREYDNPPTYEKYKEMVALKKELKEKFNIEGYIFQQLSLISDNLEELESLADIDYVEEYNNTTNFINKLIYNNIPKMKEKNLMHQAVTYYLGIDEYFSKVEPDIGEKILNIYGSIYEETKINFKEKNEILDILVSKTNSILNVNLEICQALLMYTIFKCNVLEKEVK